VPGSPEPTLPAPPFVTRWDLDKTYLRTEFDTLGDLVRTAFERPDQKRAVPGAAALLHGLGETGARVHILSGSPRQLRNKLEEKLRIDHVRWDELTLKPNLSNLLRLRLRAMRDQLGYKLPVLLGARASDQARFDDVALEEVLVGDDAEADAFVYSLYADVCDGTVEVPRLAEILRRGKVYSDQAEGCIASARSVKTGNAVLRILIHLDRQSPPSTFDAYGPRVVPFYNYLQAALVLAEDGRLGGRAVLDVASVLVLRHRFDGEGLGRSYLDLMRRGHVNGSVLPSLEQGLDALRRETPDTAVVAVLADMTRLIGGYLRDPPRVRLVKPAKPDYFELAERHQGGKNRKNFRSVTQ
jgi:hypothetical protein